MTWWHLILAVQAVTGLVWAYAAFRILFRLRARAIRESGMIFPGLSVTLRVFRGFLTDPGHGSDRRRLGALTAILLALSVLGAATGGAGR
jgi:hypothetical protein